MSTTLRLIAGLLTASALAACSGSSLPLGQNPPGKDASTNPPPDAGTCTVNSDCHKSNPDECNMCSNTSLVCRSGACVCSCQAPSPDAGSNTCAAAGGQCVAVSPSSCQNGTWGDANQYSCGGGIGVGCCLPKTLADGGQTPTCGSIGGTCTGVGSCSPGMGHIGPATSDCTSPELVCCIPESACGGAENEKCCAGGATFRPTCESASSTAFTCMSGMTFCSDGGVTTPPDAGTCTVDSDCHKTNPDQCNACTDMSLVCRSGACVCTC